MDTTRPRNGPKTRSDIREAAAALFYQHGYEATSLRAVAAQVGIKVGSLYNHMGSKDELLLDIMTDVMDQISALVENAVAAAGPDPVDRLTAGVGAHISFHATHARETFIGNSELRSLLPEQRKLIVKRRKEYENVIRDLVVAAAAARGVPILDARLQAYAVLAMGMHVASWYRNPGDIALAQVVDVYTELCLRQIGVSGPPARKKTAKRSPRAKA